MEKESSFSVDRLHYTQLMAQNLPMLRTCLGLSQLNLAEIIGVTRQTISAIESGTRKLSWGNFISLLFVFTQNEQTLLLLKTLGIYTEELESIFRIASLGPLQEQMFPHEKSKGGEEA